MSRARPVMRTALLALAVSCPLLAASAFEARLGLGGDVALGECGAQLGLRVFAEGWTGVAAGRSVGRTADNPAGDVPDPATGRARFELADAQGVFASGAATILKDAAGTARLSVDVQSLAVRQIESIAFCFDLKCPEVNGLAWSLDETRKGTFPAKFERMTLVNDIGKSLTWTDPVSRKPVTLAFDEPMRILVQDNRKWANQTYSIRFSKPESNRDFPKDAQLSFACAIRHPDGVTVSYAQPVVISHGADWLSMDFRKDILAGSALDFSVMGLHDAPAGKYGWLKSVGSRFEFEKRPGKAQRFYGVNICFTASAPDHELADRVVARLKRSGYNAIRIHHYEDMLMQGAADGEFFNAATLDRFDYLMAKAIENGIYLTTDLYVIRTVRWRDLGIDKPGAVPPNLFKALIAVNRSAFENWKNFARQFLLHRNPYTGRRYVEEPGMPLISLVNEGVMPWTWHDIRKMPEGRKAWGLWLRGRRAKDPAFAPGLGDDPAQAGEAGESAAVLCFLADLEASSARRQRAFLASLGSRALLTSQNCDDSQPMGVTRREYDYVDTHFYVDHPKFLEREWALPSKCENENPVLVRELAPVEAGFVRLADRPFTVSEWNFSGPGMYRGVGGIMTGAFAALQDWDGLWRFDYAGSVKNFLDGVGSPHYFEMNADPLSLASDRACICLFLRGDLDPLGEKIALNTGRYNGNQLFF